MNRRLYYLSSLLFVLFGLLLAYAFFPTESDVAWMYYFDRQYARSLKSFEDYYKGGIERRAVVPQVLIHLEFANDQEAIQKVEEYVRNFPQSIDARVYLGDLYKRSSRPKDYLRNLELLYELEPTAARLKELSQIYSESDSPIGQLLTIQTLIERNIAVEEDYLRLAELYAALGKREKANEVIDLLIKKEGVKHLDPETLYFIVSFYLNDERTKEAFDLALAYVKEKPSLTLAYNLGFKFLDAGRVNEATQIAELIPPGEQDSERAIELEFSLLLAKKENETIFNLFKQQFEKGKLTPRFFGRFALEALQFRDRDLLRKMMEELKFSRVSHQQLQDLIGRIILMRDREAAALLRANLGEEYLKSNPVDLIGLEIVGLTDEEIEEKLKEMKVSGANLLILAEFLDTAGQKPLAKKLLEEVTSWDEVPIDTLDETVFLYLTAGLTPEAEKLYDSYKVRPGFPLESYHKAGIYLLVAGGKKKEVLEKIDSYHLASSETLTDILNLSDEIKKPEIGLAVAELLVKKSPTVENKQLLAKALAQNGKIDQALNVLTLLADQGADVRKTRFYVLVKGVRLEPKRYTVRLDQMIDQLTMGGFNDSEVQAEGYLLIDNKLSLQAEKIFLYLTAGKKPLWRDPDVQTLLSIWAENLSPERVSWIMNAAKDSQGKELASWALYLAYNKHPEESKQLFAGKEWKSDEVAWAYKEVLVATRSEPELREVTYFLSGRPLSYEQAMELGKVAEILRIYTVAEFSYATALEKRPESMDALLSLGIVTYVQGRFFESNAIFNYYIRSGGERFEAAFNLAETCWLYEHRQGPKRLYGLALYQMTDKDLENPYIRSAWALMMQRLRHPYLAISELRSLIIEYPNRSTTFVTDLAGYFMDLDLFCKAVPLIENPERPRANDEWPTEAHFLDLNYGLTRVRFLRDTRCYKAAFNLIDQLIAQHGADPTLLAMKADLLNDVGQWRSALCVYEQASAKDPGNQRYIKSWRDIIYDNERFFFAQSELKLTGDHQNEQIWDIYVFHRFTRAFSVKVGVGVDEMRLFNALNFHDNTLFRFEDGRVRGEVGARYDSCNGYDVEASAYFSKISPGAGLYIHHKDLYGEEWLRFRYHRATWDFTQTVMFFGVEDRIDGFRLLHLGPLFDVFVGGGYEWYTLEGVSNAAETFTFQGGLTFRVPRINPFVWALGEEGVIFINYIVDAQYATFTKEEINNVGELVQPLPIEDRETHNLIVVFNKRFNKCFRADAFFGGTYDRATSGPLAPTYGVSLIWGRKGYLEASFDYIHSVSTQFAQEATDRFIVDIKVPY